MEGNVVSFLVVFLSAFGASARPRSPRVAAMASTIALLLCLMLATQLPGTTATTAGTDDGSELWGYVTVRPKAHIFWWWYKSPQRVSSPGQPCPTILWLQGGPGGSSVGRGNFREIGPLDVDFKSRSSTWLQIADLIFIDSPVGVGYSYVEDPSAMATTDKQAAMDVVEVIKALAKEIPTLLSSPLYLVGESYGGKHAVMIGISLARSIRSGSLNLNLGGVVLADSWISPDDSALSYPLLLNTMSRLDDNAMETAYRLGETVKQQIAVGQFSAAFTTLVALFSHINNRSGQVNLENILLPNNQDSLLSMLFERSSLPGGNQTTESGPNTLNSIMNGVVKEKLKIIPKDLMYQEASLSAFDSLNNSFMRPAINEVDELLMLGVNVSVINGQLDFVCSTLGTEAWLRRLRWDGLHRFLGLPRKDLYYYHCQPYQEKDFVSQVNGFVRSWKNLNFYWVLKAGHMVSVDQPCTALHIIADIVQRPFVE